MHFVAAGSLLRAIADTDEDNSTKILKYLYNMTAKTTDDGKSLHDGFKKTRLEKTVVSLKRVLTAHTILGTASKDNPTAARTPVLQHEKVKTLSQINPIVKFTCAGFPQTR
jgi:hypothetical protein